MTAKLSEITVTEYEKVQAEGWVRRMMTTGTALSLIIIDENIHDAPQQSFYRTYSNSQRYNLSLLTASLPSGCAIVQHEHQISTSRWKQVIYTTQSTLNLEWRIGGWDTDRDVRNSLPPLASVRILELGLLHSTVPGMCWSDPSNGLSFINNLVRMLKLFPNFHVSWDLVELWHDDKSWLRWGSG